MDTSFTDPVAWCLHTGYGLFSFTGTKYEAEDLGDDILMFLIANRPRSCNILIKLDNAALEFPDIF